MDPKTITIPCSGYEIVADWYAGTDSAKALLVLPGYTSSRKEHRSSVRQLIEQSGSAALVIDYSGHGDSPFELADTRPAQHFLEVICAFDWLTANSPSTQFSVSGSSYGGFLATQLTKYRRFNNLVLRAPAIYPPEAFYNLWSERLSDEEGYRSAIISYRSDERLLQSHPLLNRAGNFTGRTLVAIHGKDEIVPATVTDAYIHAFSADSFSAENFTHSINKTNVSQEQLTDYWQHIKDWLYLSK